MTILLEQYLSRTGTAIEKVHVVRMEQYARMLIHWNRKINLTAVDDEERVITHHLLDSLSVVTDLTGTNILDMGTGGGLPGVPLAILCTDKQFTLLDARNKKIQFLNQVRVQLKLDNIIPLHQRAESCQPSPKFDTVITRAFASLDKIYRLAQPLCAPTGRILAMKGRYPEDELKQLEHMGVHYEVKSLEVAGLRADRHLVLIENGQNTV